MMLQRCALLFQCDLSRITLVLPRAHLVLPNIVLIRSLALLLSYTPSQLRAQIVHLVLEVLNEVVADLEARVFSIWRMLTRLFSYIFAQFKQQHELVLPLLQLLLQSLVLCRSQVVDHSLKLAMASRLGLLLYMCRNTQPQR